MRDRRRYRVSALLFAASVAGAWLAGLQEAAAIPSYQLFEAGHVRPMARSPDGKLLFAVNTPDDRLEVFRVLPNGLQHRASIAVGMRPVAVAARSNKEVWVVNHLSDSVSIVEISGNGNHGGVVRTLLVGDEPRDIVFAGPGRRRAFITTAHRGQNTGRDPQFSTAGVGRADVWVFDAENLGNSLTGDPLNVITLFADTPRALAVSPDGERVYAAGFHSGNQTTSVFFFFVGFGPIIPPFTNFQGIFQPAALGVIAKWTGTDWVDFLGNTYNDVVKFNLPDKDVFVIDAMANPPVQVAGEGGFFTSVGTILYNMIVNPVTGKVYVANTDANNTGRGEGAGIFFGPSLNGRLHFNRITVLDPATGTVEGRHLNKHIDYDQCCDPVPNATSERSLALPLEMAITKDGRTLYVAAFGSSKVGVFDTDELENDTFVPDSANHIEVSGGGPSGLILDEKSDRLYVFTRFDNSIKTIDLASRTEVAATPLYNPEPEKIKRGRRFLYDARTTSARGDQACASCHVFGDNDDLAWDLSNPDEPVMNNPGAPFINTFNPLTGQHEDPTIHPIKGPMTTQSLRGMANHGSMHWRGDRTGGNDEPNAQPDSGIFNERLAFSKFQAGFTELLRRHGPLPDEDMEAFTDFILEVTYPPNPVRNLDNSLTPLQAEGEDRFFNQKIFRGTTTCAGCHFTDENFNAGFTDHPGAFGTKGDFTFDDTVQFFKVPHLRNMYTKIGMFGFAEIPFVFPADDDYGHRGDQIRGFGFLHDGTLDTLERFHSNFSFRQTPDNPEAIPEGQAGLSQRQAMAAFILAFPSNMKPIVGQQTTLDKKNGAVVGARIDLLESQADAGNCDLVVKAHKNGKESGFVYVGGGVYKADQSGVDDVPAASLRGLAQHGYHLTYTAVPPGSGQRQGIDRDEDGHLDGDERDAGTDPADPTSHP